MIKAIFFGGAFNPITNAHLFLPYSIMNNLHYDKVIYVPSKSSYILNVEKKNFSFTEDERIDMLKQLEKENPWMIVSDIEIKDKEQPRTYFSMKKISEQGYDLTLLIGSDWLTNLKDKWLYVDEILNEFSIIVIKRNEDNIDEIINNDPFLYKRKHKFKFTNIDGYNSISSSKIRELIRMKRYEDIKKFVPDLVYNYIWRKYHEE